MTAQSTPNMTVQVAAGHILYDNQLAAVSAVGSLAITAADSTNPRWTTVVVDSSGNISTLDGAPTAPDVNGAIPPPTADTTKITIAAIYVAAGVTSITSTVITDLRGGSPQNNGMQPQQATANSLIYTFVSGALSNADPGSGNLGFDTTDTRTIAHMYISTGGDAIVDSGGPVIDWLLGSGRLRLWSRQNPQNWLELDVTGVTTHTGYADVACTVVGLRNPIGHSVLLSTIGQDTIVEYVGPSISSIRSDPWVLLKKASDTSRSSTTTLAADPDLQFAVGAGGNYIIRGVVFFDSTSAVPGFKFDFDGPASPTRVMINYADGNQSAAPAFQVTDTALNTSHSLTTTTTGEGVLLFNIVLVNGANAGTFSFRWAQNGSFGTGVVVRTGSYLEYTSF